MTANRAPRRSRQRVPEDKPSVRTTMALAKIGLVRLSKGRLNPKSPSPAPGTAGIGPSFGEGSVGSRTTPLHDDHTKRAAAQA